MKNIKGFIFDLDGVITDTAEYHFQAWKKMADEEGLPFNRDDNEALRGVSRDESLRRLLKGKEVSLEHFQEMIERKNTYYVKLIQTMTPRDILPGMLDILKTLRKKGVKTSIGSASRNAPTVLRGLGIGEYFDNISDGSSVLNSKPAPDLFLHAADKLGLKPEECVVVEDAASGVAAGLAGGMTVIGIGPEERVGKAHFRYDNPGDIDIDMILS